MRKLVVSWVVAFVAYPFIFTAAVAQSPLLVKYCGDLTAAYRKARSEGKDPVPGAGEAIALCPTNPNDAIPTLENALKTMKVDLPSR
jgi:hypothetical protein